MATTVPGSRVQRAQLLIVNKGQALHQLDVMIRRATETRIAIYHDVVQKIFLRILNQTPQFSGRAVASWQIVINGSVEPIARSDLGDDEDILATSFTGASAPRSRGNRRWIQVAWRREKPKIARIQRPDKVAFINRVLGDTDNGDSSAFYMESLQDPAYWSKKLRSVNRPYETVFESVEYVMAKYWKRHIDPFRVYEPVATGDPNTL